MWWLNNAVSIIFIRMELRTLYTLSHSHGRNAASTYRSPHPHELIQTNIQCTAEIQTPEPSTEIVGAPDLYIESGSTINLTCIIEDSPEPPAYIFWNHNNAVSI